MKLAASQFLILVAGARPMRHRRRVLEAIRIDWMDWKKKAQFYMLPSACQRACIAFLAAAIGSSAWAQQYQLRLDSPSLFRLSPGESREPVPAESGDAPGSARLAEFPFSAQIERAARRVALDPALIHALIYVESRHNPAARSPKGALGLMQVMPATAARYGVRDAIRSVDENLSAGTSYLRDLMNLFDGRLELALAAYNAGENAVLRYGLQIPPYRETREYVPAVLAKFEELREISPSPASPPQRREYLPGTLLHLPRPATRP